jgi:hypothetical protein
VSFPGADDADSGARAVGSGGRSVTVADSTSYEAPDTVLAAVPDPGCATTVRQDARVGPYEGVALTHTGCPGGVTVTDVVVGNEGTDEFSVWVQVRSVDGDPDVADVLGSLRTP